MFTKNRQGKILFVFLMAIVLLVSACGQTPKQNETDKQTETGKETEKETPKEPEKQEENKETEVNLERTGGLKLPLVDRPTTITWMVPSDVENLNDLLIAKELEKRTGVKVEFMVFPQKSYEEKLHTMIGSGKLPDIVNGLRLDEANNFGLLGAFANIADYVDELPNFKSLYVDNPENNWLMYSWATDDGGLYKWPIYGLSRDVNHGLMYRADIFKKHGIEPWKNTEEFYNALVKLKEIYPDSYPFASKNTIHIFRLMARYWNISDNRYPFYYDENTSKWAYAGTSKEMKEMLDLMKKMYQNGLLDLEFLTDTQDSWSAKMTNDKAFVIYDWIGRMGLFKSQVGDANPDFDLQFAHPIGFGKQHPLAKIEPFGPNVSKGENELVALKLLDYLSSPEGSELFTLGVEGVNFEFDADGKPVYAELKNESLIDIRTLEKNYGMWIEGSYVRPDHRSVYYIFSDAEQKAQDMANKVSGYNTADPEIKLTDAENEVYTEVFTAIDKEFQTFASKYVTDNAYGDKEWEAFTKTAESMNVNKAIDVLNAAQERFNNR
ncbi:MAG: extracellular solute-binding protein [Eubacteriales bacterium]|nr:extracellular solute-binding protein [Eubacteriales bacterium]